MGTAGWMRRWAPGLAAAGVLALVVVPRFVLLETRPVIHDESLFSYYSLIFREQSHYTHNPMLHGPALMLSLGTVFSVFDDTIAVGRAFAAACSLVVLGLLLALAPARTRWWLAPLLAYATRCSTTPCS
jgi:predicted membrane-bound mannosyltransferase